MEIVVAVQYRVNVNESKNKSVRASLVAVGTVDLITNYRAPSA